MQRALERRLRSYHRRFREMSENVSHEEDALAVFHAAEARSFVSASLVERHQVVGSHHP